MHEKNLYFKWKSQNKWQYKRLIKYFTKGAETVGHEVTCFDLRKK